MTFDCQNALIIEVRDPGALMIKRVEHGRCVEELRVFLLKRQKLSMLEKNG